MFHSKKVTELVVKKRYKILNSLLIKNTSINLAAWTSLNIFHWPGEVRTLMSEHTGGFKIRHWDLGWQKKKTKQGNCEENRQTTWTHFLLLLIIISFILMTSFRHWGHSYIRSTKNNHKVCSSPSAWLQQLLHDTQDLQTCRDLRWVQVRFRLTHFDCIKDRNSLIQPGGYRFYSSIIGHGGNTLTDI